MAPVQPKSMVLNIYGAYGRSLGGWIAVAALVELLSDLGYDERTSRAAISRMKSKGLLEPDRREGRVGYVLTDEAKEVLTEGDRRILARQAPARLEEGWALAVFSVPEAERHARHLLRSRLTWQGFGNVAPGAWIAPWRLAGETRAMLVRLGLHCYVDLFHAHHYAFRPTAEQVGRWWDLDRLAIGYSEFLRVCLATREQWRTGRNGDREAFCDYLATVASWQRFPYLDPVLPSELLPPDWEGQRAAELFFELSDMLADRGGEHVAAVFERAEQRGRTGT
ncbi:MAG: PaaX family transcriptional regulator [Acidimicrobiales bacterium]